MATGYGNNAGNNI